MLSSNLGDKMREIIHDAKAKDEVTLDDPFQWYEEHYGDKDSNQSYSPTKEGSDLGDDSQSVHGEIDDRSNDSETGHP